MIFLVGLVCMSANIAAVVINPNLYSCGFILLGAVMMATGHE